MNNISSPVIEVSGLNLSSMFKSPVFTSQSPFESQRRLSMELVDHEMEWRRGPVDTALYRGKIGRCEILALRYGAEVEIRPKPFQDFVLIQMPIQGSAVLQSSGVTHQVNPGQAAIFSPGEHSSLLWRQDCEQLMLKLPKSLIDWAKLQLQEEGHDQIILPEISCLGRAMAKRWFRLVAELLDCMPGNDCASPRWLRQVEESLALFIISNQLQKVNTDQHECPQSSTRQTKRLEEFIRERLGQDTTLTELATTVGVSVRSLHSICQREYGKSPMELLRSFRLEAARARLLQSKEISVTEVALEYGFSHVGRFANYYRQRFGELPRITARGG